MFLGTVAGEHDESRMQTYEAPGITVTFDPSRCIHAAAASPDAVAAQVERCPSGALQYQRTSVR